MTENHPQPPTAEQVCACCARPSQGNYSIHRDGFCVGPEVPLCDHCGAETLPTCVEIWAKIKCAHPEVEEAVIAKIISRRDAGRKKYGTTMERSDLPTIDWLRHAQEEALDFAIYLERLIRDLKPTE